MINVNELKKQAEAMMNATTTEGNVINLNNIFEQKAELILTDLGYHNFKIVSFRTTDNSITFVGELTNDEGKVIDNNNYRLSIRCYGDGNIFRQQFRDILEQLKLPLNADLNILPELVDKTFVVRVTKNARGYANYTFNQHTIVAEMMNEMNNNAE